MHDFLSIFNSKLVFGNFLIIDKSTSIYFANEYFINCLGNIDDSTVVMLHSLNDVFAVSHQ